MGFNWKDPLKIFPWTQQKEELDKQNKNRPPFNTGGFGTGEIPADQYARKTPDDWLRGAISGYTGIGPYFNSFSNAEESLSAGGGNKLAQYIFGGKASLQAYSNLMSLLANQGMTDPRMMNRNLAAIQRDTQGQQQGLAGFMQGRGWQNSGVGAALQAAIGAGGAGRAADYRASEAQKAEDRRRMDLEIFQRLIGQPATDQTALGLGQYNAQAQQQQAKNAQQAALLAGLLGALSGG